jgi:hypothetical protein
MVGKIRLRVLLAAALLASLAGGTFDAAADSSSAGNSVFRIVVEDSANRDGIGTFTVSTGPDHPAGEGQPVLFSGTSGAGSSAITVRSYTTGTDYVQTTTAPGSANIVRTLDDTGVSEPVASTGYRTTYSLAAVAGVPDDLTIVSTIDVTGSGLDGSAVEIATSLRNEGDVPLTLGVRYLLDFAPAGDDGPTLAVGGAGGTSATEMSLAPAPAAVTISPNKPGAARVDTDVSSPVTPPDVLEFVSWTHAFPFAFDYTPAARDVAAEDGLNDSAVLVYFGANEAQAVTLTPGQSTEVTVRLSLTAAPATASPTPSPAPAPATPTPTPVSPRLPVELPRTGSSPRER